MKTTGFIYGPNEMLLTKLAWSNPNTGAIFVSLHGLNYIKSPQVSGQKKDYLMKAWGKLVNCKIIVKSSPHTIYQNKFERD